MGKKPSRTPPPELCALRGELGVMQRRVAELHGRISDLELTLWFLLAGLVIGVSLAVYQARFAE